MSDLISTLRIVVLSMKDRQLLQGVIKEVTWLLPSEGIELAAMNHRRLVLKSGQERADTIDILIEVGFWVYLRWTIKETQQAGMTKPSA